MLILLTTLCGLKSTLMKMPEARESNILPPMQHKRLSASQMAPKMYPAGYNMQMFAQESHKLHDLKINKHKSGYSAIDNLIFQSLLKDIRFHVEDWNVTQREAIQLIKDCIGECAHDEEEFYMGLVVQEKQTFEGLVNHLESTFQCEIISE